MKKRIMSLVLALALTVCALPIGAQAADSIEFTPDILKKLDVSHANWLSTSENRAMFAVLLLADFGSSTSYELSNIDLTYNAYLSDINGVGLGLTVYSEKGEVLTLVYIPLLKTAQYSVLSSGSLSSSSFQTIMNRFNSTSDYTTYTVSYLELVNAALELSDMLGDD